MTAAKPTKRRSRSASEPAAKYNLGAGESWVDGFINIDLSGANQNVDLSQFPWPLADADEIQASHILEHFTKEQARLFLAECYRVLIPGGKLHIAVPDMDIFVECKLSGNWDRVGRYTWKDFNWFFGGNEVETRLEMRHYYMYNIETLTAMLQRAGFTTITKRNMLPIDNPLYEQISLYVTAVKEQP